MGDRPLEKVQGPTVISATLPLKNVGNFDVKTFGAPTIGIECEAVDGAVVKVFAKRRAGGTWRKYRCFQNPVDSDTRTLREPNTSITLTLGDTIIVQAATYYAVRVALQSGTSATLSASTGENIGDVIQTSPGGGKDVVLQSEKTDDTAFTPGTSSVVAIGAMADETGADSVDEGDIGIPRMTLDRVLKVVNYPDSGIAYHNGKPYTVQRAAIVLDATGAIVPQTASKFGVLLDLTLAPLAGVTDTFHISDGTIALLGDSSNPLPLSEDGASGPAGISRHFPYGLKTGAVNRAITLTITGGGDVSGCVAYILTDD